MRNGRPHVKRSVLKRNVGFGVGVPEHVLDGLSVVLGVGGNDLVAKLEAFMAEVHPRVVFGQLL